MNAALFSEAGQFRNLSAVFDKSHLLEVAKSPTTNYFTANGIKILIFFFAKGSSFWSVLP